MSREFGYDYPAGAEHDPNAPWNQVDDEQELEWRDVPVLGGSIYIEYTDDDDLDEKLTELNKIKWLEIEVSK